MTVLLVTGSRALCDTTEARAWMINAVRREIDALAPGSLVVTGDASGPDGQASDRAANRALPLEVWNRYGLVVGVRGVVRRWTTAPDPSSPAEWRERLLARDRAMVARVTEQTGERRCVAFVAPWSKTHGTAYTARHAKAAGIATTILTCPMEFAPKGGVR